MTKALALLTMLAIGLTGCANPDAGNVPSSPSGETAQDLPTALSPEQVIEASVSAFETLGMTEFVSSGGDNYILTYEPGETFVAALYNESFDDVISIDQPEMFTVYAAHLMSQTKGVSYVETECGFEITAPYSPGMSLCIQDGLIISGSALDGSWEGNFNYSTDQDVLALIGQEQ